MTQKQNSPAIVWFRDDLRLADQPALAAAIATGAPVLCVFILDEESPGARAHGGASRWWLHHSLAALGASLEAIGGRLDLLRGPAAATIEALARATGAGHVFWTRRYGPADVAIDADAKARLKALGIEAVSHNGQLHDRASYRFFWQVLQRAHHTGRTLPAEVRIFFENHQGATHA